MECCDHAKERRVKNEVRKRMESFAYGGTGVEKNQFNFALRRRAISASIFAIELIKKR